MKKFPTEFTDIRNYDQNPEPIFLNDSQTWDNINWIHVRNFIQCKQTKIYEASKENKVEEMHKLQYDLLEAFESKLLATRRVVQDNIGRRTRGFGDKSKVHKKDRIKFAQNLCIDGNANVIRRIYIPKPGKREKRPLGIPFYEDRAKQAIVKMILEPQWEAKFSPQSFGFRPGLAQRDAISSITNCIKQQEKYVLDADIRKCFDRINHDKLLEKMDTFEVIRIQVKAWLKAGLHDELNDIIIQENDMGTPQGGIISPLLMNIALHGIEDIGIKIINDVKWSMDYTKYRAKNAFKLVRYADDFVAFHTKKWVIEELREKIQEFLKAMGLELHEDKTFVRHTLNKEGELNPGFNFVGVRFIHNSTRKHSALSGHKKKLGYNLNVIPSVENV